MSFQIILGSSSMARRQILAEMGYDFTILTADIDEKAIRKEKTEDLVMALAEAKKTVLPPRKFIYNTQKEHVSPHSFINFLKKTRTTSNVTSSITAAVGSNKSYAFMKKLRSADAILSRLQSAGICKDDAPPTLLITADTVVVYKGTIREKPSSKEEAREFIKGYSGGHGSVVGSVLVTNLKSGSRKGGWERAEVYFHDIPDEVIDSLIEEDITLNVAGGLMLEHPLTVPFVDSVVGTVDCVMGLPKALTEELIHEALQLP